MSEYITLGKAVDLQSSVKCKWLKFDDEFVSEMPVHENPFSLVTGSFYSCLSCLEVISTAIIGTTTTTTTTT